MTHKELRRGGGGGEWSPSTLLEALSTSFDDLEAYAYMNGGDLILRSEYELLILRVPSALTYSDLEAYVERLGGSVYPCRRGLGIILPTISGPRLAFHARIIHREAGNTYLAIEPRGVVSKGRRPSLC